jgi:hypothetical protein
MHASAEFYIYNYIRTLISLFGKWKPVTLSYRVIRIPKSNKLQLQFNKGLHEAGYDDWR